MSVMKGLLQKALVNEAYMELLNTLNDYYLLHYKQHKENLEKSLQDRLVVVLKAAGTKTLNIKKLSPWERIRAVFDFGPASKSSVLAFIKKVTPLKHLPAIEEKANLIFSNKDQAFDTSTVLVCISECHNKSLIQDVINKPEILAAINTKIKNGDTVLMLSIKNSNKEAFEVLLNTDGIALDEENHINDYTALLLAMEQNNPEFVNKLVSKGCLIPLKAYSLAKNSPRALAAIKNASAKQKSGLLIDTVVHSNISAFKKIVNEIHELDMLPALEKAIENNRLEMVEIALGHGIDKAAALQITLQQWAAGKLNTDSLVYKKMIDLNRHNLQSAIGMLSEIYPGSSVRTTDEYVALIQSFIEQDDYIRINSEACYDALIQSAKRGNWNLVEAFIIAGVNPNLKPNGASDLLLRAASRAGPKTIELLLAHGADVTYKDLKNNTPISRAELRLEHGHIPGGLEESEKVLSILKAALEKKQ